MEFSTDQLIYIGSGLLTAMGAALGVLYRHNMSLTEKLIALNNNNIDKMNELTHAVNRLNDKWFSILENLLDQKMES